MISPQMARQALQYAAWIIVVAGCLLPFLDRQSAEFIITAASLAMGITFAGLVWVLTRRSMK
jgi:hypothetical protein